MEQEIEVWLPIIGFEGRYEVSSYGQVRSLGFERKMRHGTGFMKGRILKLNKNKPGYYQVFLCDDAGDVKVHRVHRLVGIHHIPNPDNLPAVNHIDGDKLNNAKSNLEWTTLEENTQHSVKVLGKTIGVFTPVKVTVEKDGIPHDYDSISDASRAIGCKKSALVMALRRNNKCHGYSIKKQTA